MEFDESSDGDLYTARGVEPLLDFSPLAERPRHCRMAGKIGAFLLNNMPSGIAQPYTYDTMRSTLANLARTDGPAWTLVQCAVVLKTAFLYENGLLPEGTDARQTEFLETLVAAGIDDSPLPECPEEYFDKLNEWLNALIAYHQLKK